MNGLSALIVVAVLLGTVWLGAGVAGQESLFGVVIPYAAITVFLLGVVYRVLRWARAPVPFKITSSSGQQTSLPWIEPERLESPPDAKWTVVRMALEILFFRSLFRNTKASLAEGKKLVHQSDRLLWLGALAFHWSFLIIFLRHLRFFLEPVPAFVQGLERMDELFQVAVPSLFLTDVVIVVALVYLLGRRFFNPLVRYISLASDYLALYLLLGVALSGILMRYFTRVDLLAAKQFALGLVTLRPTSPEGIGLAFYVHVFFVSVLFAYFPFSKLMHMGGVFLSPTRNMPNDNRRRRHVNPINPEVEVHTYAQWEEEFKDKLEAAGIPLDRG
ncbi:MAG: sulfate reduction electron transfer complex DsrMKJOP subunit DsrM [Acidobacteria bacterium]|jgi:nitrate reductase gamma subunit|nr:sulfate reduction electron transfer complex DsrMKJOP subunit DsrM [Acidobacteriota bacterium]